MASIHLSYSRAPGGKKPSLKRKAKLISVTEVTNSLKATSIEPQTNIDTPCKLSSENNKIHPVIEKTKKTNVTKIQESSSLHLKSQKPSSDSKDTGHSLIVEQKSRLQIDFYPHKFKGFNAMYDNLFKIEKELNIFNNEKLLKYRKALSTWTIDVCNYFELDAITTNYALHILDQVFPDASSSRDQLEILSISCITISAKMFESVEDTPPLITLQKIIKNTLSSSELCNSELSILKKINWSLSDILPSHFLNYQKTAIINQSSHSYKKELISFFESAHKLNLLLWMEPELINNQLPSFISAIVLKICLDHFLVTDQSLSINFEALTKHSVDSVTKYIIDNKSLIDSLLHDACT
jgi:hypothetical protein